jgi:hypothetical protein
MLSKVLLAEIAGLVAPIVTLFYRKGIWVTPDDPVSPYGMGEEFMRRLYAHAPKWFADWWWLGLRNRAYGLAYKLKPEVLKGLTDYKGITFTKEETPKKRVITAEINGEKFTETTWFFKIFLVIYGYRLRPMMDNSEGIHPVKEFSMDGRPLLSIRWGKYDD